MNKAIMDSTTLIDIQRGKHKRLVARATVYFKRYKKYTISIAGLIEMVVGFQTVGDEKSLQQFLQNTSELEVMPLTQNAAILTGRIYADLENAGKRIGFADTMTGAIAIDCGLPLATSNTEHFSRIHDLGYPLTLEDWRE